MSQPKEHKDAMIDPGLLSTIAYKDSSRLTRRKALYEYTAPHYNIEDKVVARLGLQDDDLLLDVGCGTGKLLLKCASQNPGANLIGLDISSGVFQAARQQTEREGLNIDFVTAGVQNIPFPTDYFDKVVAMHMLYHANDIHQALSEIHRVTKPEGVVVITANSVSSRKQLGFLKNQAAQIMNRDVFTDPNVRFNLEDGLELAKQHFAHVTLIPFDSRLRLTNSEPYLDYFDSLRGFWQPEPSDRDWQKVMNLVKQYIDDQITTVGEFSDKLGFGMIIASDTPLVEKGK